MNNDIETNIPQFKTEDFDSYLELKSFIARCLQLNHELNNPLAGIIGYCDFLLETNQEIPDQLVVYIKQILSCAEKMEKTIQELSQSKVKLSEKLDLPSLFEIYKKK